MAINTRRDRFHRVAARRAERVLRDLRQLRRCANRAGYDYTPEEVEKMCVALECEMRRTREAFAGNQGSIRFTFGERA